MQRFYKSLLPLFIFGLSGLAVHAQVTDTTINSLDADLLNIFNQKNPQKYKVAEIKVTGNKYFDQALLTSVAGISVGDEITIPGGDNFSKAINKLWAQNYFSDVAIYITKLEGTNIYLEINVTERPRLSNYFLKNINKSEQDDLGPKTGLIKGRVVTENMKRTAIDAIDKFYFEKGFRNVKVNIDAQKDTGLENSVVLYLYINKGSKVKINQINFIDNKTVSELKLKKQMKGTKEMSRLTLYPPRDSGGLANPTRYTFSDYLNEKGYLTFTKTKRVLDPYIRIKIFTNAKFDEKKYEDDKEKIIDYYNSLGNRDAAIVDSKVYPNNKGNINIDIKLDEGHKYYFGDITWKGNSKYSDSLLTVLLGIKKGDIYNAELLNKKLGKSISPEGGDISGLYMDDGYLFFQVNPIETAVYNDTIDFEIKIQEGPQARWKNVRIAGNDRTKEYVIRRELRTLPGEKFSRSDVIRSQREIANLSFFDQEKINPNIVPNPEDGTVDVTWNVVEKSSDQLELSAGFGGGIGLTGTVGVSFNNFSVKNIWNKKAWDPLPVGDGQKLSLRIQSNGRAYRSYNISFTEPWLGGKKRNAFTVSFYDTKFANAYDYATGQYTKTAADTSYFKTTGASIGLQKQLKWPDDYFSFGASISYARYKLRNYAISQTLALPDGTLFRNGYSNNLSLRLNLTRYSLDQQIFPRTGSNFSLSLALTPPFSLLNKNLVNSSNPYKWIEYHKWRFTGEWYVPIGKPAGEEHNRQFVLKMAAKFGYIGRYNNDLEVSPFERFQVGDAGLSNTYALLGYDIISHRGYPVYENSDPRVNPDQQGASQYFTMFNKYTLELRYPFSTSASSTIYGLTFFEAANGWYSFKDYNPFQLRRSVGVGVRFFLPMFGLLGFDYGVGLDRYRSGGTLKDASRFTFMLGFEPD
ncbi:BamA/TamA family outer membrane protein [Panacibacter ginsenosidivorans]|uniref:BamA/TamA family outer membrane protein n=1 Tax=Panacibacter ginsenosidivorans TaxID=1813871 RepID=A0A5B8VA33_9BACT|nr:POTRA domain-containing protein [Panacibacter ginsenosidivorans]QEC67975.1 BamA/TamA family outer membrane protein [Panacibacter ginsenosidivorans]